MTDDYLNQITNMINEYLGRDSLYGIARMFKSNVGYDNRKTGI